MKHFETIPQNTTPCVLKIYSFVRGRLSICYHNIVAPEILHRERRSWGERVKMSPRYIFMYRSTIMNKIFRFFVRRSDQGRKLLNERMT
uniref:Uncharacterized protein n=1 Tax=Octopus bimaculoides TaxID=37653 RepID=A0A0L8GF28_OCTBM